jgi:cysteine desulfurase
MHADACQALPSLPVDGTALGVDLLSVSARKAYGPQGAGALYVRRGLDIDPFLRGEARPHGAWPRPNVAAAAAMAGALRALRPEIPELAGRLWGLSERLRGGLAEADPAIRVLGHPTHRLPHIVSWSVVGIDRETLFMALEDRGILAGAGRSPVLSRAGLVEAGAAVVRLGLWSETTDDDVDRVVAAVPDIVGRLRGMAARVADGSAREG